MKEFIKRYWIFLFIILIVEIISKPLIISHQIPFSSNLLASFFNPWAQEKFPGWSQGIPNKPVGIDDLRIFYPQRTFTTNTFKSITFPYWNPYNFSGNYHAGLSETAVFYPLFFLFIFLPQLPTWVFLQLMEPVIASIGAYLFLKVLTKEKITAVFGAIVFGFSGLIIVRMVEGLSVGHTLIWLPWIFFGIEAYLQKRQNKFLVLATLFLLLSILAGWFQYTFYIFFLGITYAIFRRSLLALLPFIFAPLISLFHIIPALESLQSSSRSVPIKSILDGHLMPIGHLLTLLNPDLWGNPSVYNFFGKSEYKESILYIGTIPFFVSIFGLIFLRRDKRSIFFFLITLIGLTLGTDNVVSRFILSFPIPITSMFLPNRIFIFSTFGLSVLSSYGFLYLLESKHISKKLLLLFVLIAGFLFLSANRFYHSFIPDFSQSQIFIKNLKLANVFLVIFITILIIRQFLNKKVFIIGLFITTIFGQVYFAQKYIPWSQAQFVFPPNPVLNFLKIHQEANRFISLGLGYIPSNIPLFFQIYSPDGVGSMYIKRYGELVTYVQSKGKFSNSIPRIEIRINPTTKSLFTNADKYMLRFMQIDGIKYLVKLKNETDPEGLNTVGNAKFPLIWQNKTWQIFEYKDVLPRVFWTNQYIVGKNDKEILQSMFDFSKSTQRIVIEKQPLLVIDQKSTGSARLVKYSAQNVVIKTNSTGNGLIFLSDTYTPNFSVLIDHKSTEILRADYAFRAISVPKGQHTITLSYSDSKETLAFLLSGFLILTAGGIALYNKKNR